MTTKVVSVRVKEIRPAYPDLKAWCANPTNCYIGRGRIVDHYTYPPTDSVWANPFKDSDRAECLAKYETHLRQLLAQPGMLDELGKLKGKNLGCWCRDGPNKNIPGWWCHGDVLVTYINHYFPDPVQK